MVHTKAKGGNILFKLGYGDKRPIYEQIKDKMKELIISGALSEDERIPSVRELALTMAINPNTIQKAYKELENEGYIYSLRAKGYFVCHVETGAFSKKIENLLGGIHKQAEELYFLGVPENKITSVIKEIYNGGKSDDKG